MAAHPRPQVRCPAGRAEPLGSRRSRRWGRGHGGRRRWHRERRGLPLLKGLRTSCRGASSRWWDGRRPGWSRPADLSDSHHQEESATSGQHRPGAVRATPQKVQGARCGGHNAADEKGRSDGDQRKLPVPARAMGAGRPGARQWLRHVGRQGFPGNEPVAPQATKGERTRTIPRRRAMAACPAARISTVPRARFHTDRSECRRLTSDVVEVPSEGRAWLPHLRAVMQSHLAGQSSTPLRSHPAPGQETLVSR